MGHKIGRIYRNPDYKYEIIIPDNSSPSPSSRGRSSQPTKRDYLTKSNRNELLFLSSLLFQQTWFLTDFLSRSFNLETRPPIPLRGMGPTFFNPRISSSFSFNSNRIPSIFPLYLTIDETSTNDHRFRQPIDLLPFTEFHVLKLSSLIRSRSLLVFLFSRVRIVSILFFYIYIYIYTRTLLFFILKQTQESNSLQTGKRDAITWKCLYTGPCL